MGSIPGSILGAVLVTVLLEVLRPVKNYMPYGIDPRMVLFSILLILLMLTRPTGLLGNRQKLWSTRRRPKPEGVA
jgi:branched-chain amino acid transport system permease protein